MSKPLPITNRKPQYIEKPIVFKLEYFCNEVGLSYKNVRMTPIYESTLSALLEYCYQYAWNKDLTFKEIVEICGTTYLVFTKSIFVSNMDHKKIKDYKFFKDKNDNT